MRKKQVAAEKKKSDLESAISKLEAKAASTASDALRRGYFSQIKSKQRQLESARRDSAAVVGELSKAQEKLTERQGKLRKAEADAASKQADKEKRQRKRREREERLDKQRRERDERRSEEIQRHREAERDREIDALGHQTLELGQQTSALAQRLAEAERRAAPPEITVLFLAASPTDQDRLRLGPETREIQKRVRASEHRDSVNLEWRLGRQLTDLIEDLGQVEPDVLHFSGHSNDAELAFETEDGVTACLTKDQLGRLVNVSGKSIRLVVLNSCNSAELAQAACAAGHVELAIGMNASIDNQLAKTFAGQFYASLGNGHSVGQAFDEARLQLELAHATGQNLPEIFAAEDVDPVTVVLVNPDGDVE